MMMLRCYVRVGLPDAEKLASTESYMSGEVKDSAALAQAISTYLGEIRKDATFIEVRATVTDR